MSEPTRERITHLRANGLLLDHHGIPPSGADNVSDEEWQALCDMALRSLASPSATGAISQYRQFAQSLRNGDLFEEPVSWPNVSDQIHMAADTIDALCALLAAAPAPAEPVDVPKPPYDPDYLLEVAENTLIPMDEKKKAALFAVCDLFSKPDGYVKPPQVDHGGQSSEAQATPTSARVEAERTSEIVGWMVEGICDGEEIVRDLFDELDKDQAIAFQKNNGGLIVPLVALRDAAPQLHPDMKPGSQS